MKPLEGIKVVDFTQAHAGSLCTMLLADFGAEVIKIERPGVGDLARYWTPFKNDSSGYYAYLNRGKKSLGINGGTEEGKKILLELIKDADVVAENFKYGSMERMGLGYDVIKEANPNIIYASLNGYGQSGPLKETIGLDLQLQAGSGMMDRTGFADGVPTKGGPAMGDQLSGTYMANAIMLALINREKTGEGQKIDIAIYDCLFSIMEGHPATVSKTGTTNERMGNGDPTAVPYDTYKTNDGYVAVGVSADGQWVKFCEALGMDDLGSNPAYDKNVDRVKAHDELTEIIGERLSKMSKFEVEQKLWEARVPCGAVYSVVEAMESDQVASRNMLTEVYDEGIGETIRVPGVVAHLSGTPGSIEEGAPNLGHHTVEYLSKLGYSEAQIKELEEQQVIQLA